MLKSIALQTKKSRPCSPIWDKWNGSSGHTPCPCPTCPTKIWRPPQESPCSTCPTKIWRPPSPCPTWISTPTCPDLFKNIFAIWCAPAEPFRCAVYRCFRTKSQQHDKQNPLHKILATVLCCFRRVSPRRCLRTQSSKFTSVGLGTKRLAPFAHSVLVITLSQTSFAALVCLRGLLRVGSRVVIPNLWPRCKWCSCSSGCSTRRHRDSSDAHVAAARRSVLFLPLFACSPSRVGQFSKKIDF